MELNVIECILRSIRFIADLHEHCEDVSLLVLIIMLSSEKDKLHPQIFTCCTTISH